MVMIFAYTNCPDVCNAQLAALSAALRRSSDSVKDNVRVVMVSTDPARDTLIRAPSGNTATVRAGSRWAA